MIFPNLKLTPMLKLHLARAGERLPKHLIKAESQLLRKQIEHGITSAFDRAIENSTFTHKYAAIINLSPRPIGEHGYQDMLRGLTAPGHGLLFKRPNTEGGLLVMGDPPAHGVPDGFIPLPVNPQSLPEPARRADVVLTRRFVAQWGSAAITIPDARIPDLVWMVERLEGDIRCIVAADGGVMVVFRVEADDFRSWQRECQRLRQWFADRELPLGRFSMHTLVPFSRKTRGRGGLLDLA